MIAWSLVAASCGDAVPRLLPAEDRRPIDDNAATLVARFVHISDAQLVDEESPGRLAALAALVPSAWRPHEAYSVHLLDGTIRTVNKLHVTEGPIAFLVHTGDAVDNAQYNELKWFVQAMDGGPIDPRSGPDDRPPDRRPDPSLDPHAPFASQGLYQQGVHGPLPSIPWYAVAGNHDRFATGTLPIVRNVIGGLTAPLPLDLRIGLTLPVALDPEGNLAWGAITPANPGPPAAVNFPQVVPPNNERRFITPLEFVAAHLQSTSPPRGHGFSADDPGRTWYAATPVANLRLIALNSSTPFLPQAGQIYSEGAISLSQRLFLEDQLAIAQSQGEWVIVATHHPSDALEFAYGTSLGPQTFRQLLRRHACVKLHIAGHDHNSMAFDHGGYVELVTGAIIDTPHQGRIVELWRVAGSAALRYRFFHHLDEIEPPSQDVEDLFADPYRALRRTAQRLAEGHRP